MIYIITEKSGYSEQVSNIPNFKKHEEEIKNTMRKHECTRTEAIRILESR